MSRGTRPRLACCPPPGDNRPNTGSRAGLVISAGAVEKHVASIFGKLGLPPSESDTRRVLAMLRFLET
jgi:hypothetical protein